MYLLCCTTARSLPEIPIALFPCAIPNASGISSRRKLTSLMESMERMMAIMMMSVVFQISPIEEISVSNNVNGGSGADSNKDGEDGNVGGNAGDRQCSTSAGGSIGGTRQGVAAALAGGSVSARTSIAGACICMSRQSKYSAASAQSFNFSDLVQFMSMHAETENTIEERH